MKRERIHRFVTQAAVFGIAAMFAASGLLKLLDPARFAVDIGRYGLVSPMLAAALAVYLPWVEIFVGAGLATPRLRPSARLSALLLLGVFSLALLGVLARGIDLRCGCFGEGGMSAGWALLRNLVLAALLLRPVYRPLP